MRHYSRLNVLLILTGALLGLLLGIIIGIQLFLGTGSAGRMIQERLNAAIPGEIHWESQRISLLQGQAEIRKLSILTAENKPIILAESLLIDIGLIDLFTGAIIIQTVQLERPDIFLETDDRGQLNLIRAFVRPAEESVLQPEAETAGLPFNIEINELKLTQGNFSLQLPDRESQTETWSIDIEATGLEVSGDNLSRTTGLLELSIDTGHVAVAGIATILQKFHLSAGLANDRLEPLYLDIQTPESRLSLTGSVADLFTQPQFALHLDVFSELSEIQQLFHLESDLAGPVFLQMTASGVIDNPDISMQLHYGKGRLLGKRVKKIALHCRMQNRQVTINQFVAALDAVNLNVTGSIDLQPVFPHGFLTSPIHLDAITYALDFKNSVTRIRALPGVDQRFSGEIVSHLHLEGRGISTKDLTASVAADIQGRQIAVKNLLQPLDMHISVQADLDDGFATLDQSFLEISGTRVTFAGKYDVQQNSIQMQANTEILSLEKFLQPLPIAGISGQAALQVNISGPVKAPAIKAGISGQHLGYQNITVGSLIADVDFEDGRLRIQSLELKKNQSKFSLFGHVDLFDSQSRQLLTEPVVNMELPESHLYLEDFVPGLSGEMKLSGYIDGSLKNMKGELVIDGRDLDTGIQIVPAFHLESRIDGQRILFAPLSVTLAPEEYLHAEGWVALDQTYNLRVISDGLKLSTLEILEDTDLGGQVEISASGAGHFNAPEMDGHLHFTMLNIGDKPLPEMKVRINLRDNLIRAIIDHPVSITTRLDLTDLNFFVNAELSDTQMAPYFQLIGCRNLTGRISGSLEAAGNVGNPAAMRANLAISNFSVLHDNNELLCASNITAALKNGEITLPGSRIKLLQEGHVNIQGSGSLDQELNVTVEGRIPVKIISGIVAGIEAPNGIITFKTRLSGTLDQPDIFTNIVLENFGLTLLATDQKIHAVNGHIHIAGQTATIQTVSGYLDDGDFSVEGNFELERFVPSSVDLRLITHILPIIIPDVMEMQINADLKITGTPEQSRLSGDILLLEGRYFQDVKFSLIDAAGKLGNRKRQSAFRSQSRERSLPFFNHLSLDIDLTNRNPFVVDNNLALLHIKPILHIQGSVTDPVATGRIEVTKGTISYRDTDFKVKEGVITFINPYRNEPRVSIQAESQVRHWLITLAISGQPENLDIRLTSNPREENIDILSLLAVGKTTQELLANTGGTTRSPEEILTNLVAGKLGKQLKTETGLDTVELEYRQSGTEAEKTDELKVTLGKELSRRLTVKYGVDMERKSSRVVQQSTAIYKLLENLSLKAYQDTAGIFGGEVRYRLEFR